MNLVATAETAQDVASGLNKFLEPVAESSTEITRLMSECFAISSALRELSTALREPRHSRSYSIISENLRLAVSSLEYTFDDVGRLCGRIPRTRNSAYRSIWRDIENYFQDESRNSLLARLEYYRRFLQDLLCIILERSPPDWDLYEDHRERIDALLEVQETRLEDDFDNMSPGAAGTSRHRSFERRRPTLPRLSSEIRMERRNRPSFSWREEGPRISRPHTPTSPPFDDGLDDWLPPVPDPPRSQSPAATFSQSSSTSTCFTHWALRVFEQSRSTTPFGTAGPPSQLFGSDMPNASGRLAEHHDKILQLPFENGDLVARLYVRSDRLKSGMHCRTFRAKKPPKQSYISLSSLRVERQDSSLKFYRVGSDGRPSELWAILRFASYERMVLFFCTFRSIKAEDTTRSTWDIENHELRAESDLYAGKIRHDYEEHALRLYKDRDSGGIRLEASVLHGVLKRTPIWTAFVTHLVQSDRWMHQISSKTIHLAELQRYVFNSDYNAQPFESDEENELSFVNSADARAFMSVVLDLVRR